MASTGLSVRCPSAMHHEKMALRYDFVFCAVSRFSLYRGAMTPSTSPAPPICQRVGSRTGCPQERDGELPCLFQVDDGVSTEPDARRPPVDLDALRPRPGS